MEGDSFRIFVIGGIILSIFISRINKLVGGIVSFLVTTGILVFGLSLYAEPGWTLMIFGIEISKGVFIILIIVWYAFDIKQILDRIKEGSLLKNLRNQASEKLRSGARANDVLFQMVSGLENQDDSTKVLMRDILQKKDYKMSVEEIKRLMGVDTGNAVLLYKNGLDVINDLQQIILKESEKIKIQVYENEMKPFPLPSVKVLSSKTVTMTKKINKGELIFSYNDKLITSFQELKDESSQVSQESKVQVGIIHLDQQTQLWSFKYLDVKGGDLGIKAETNV